MYVFLIKQGQTPLHVAVSNADTQIVELLIEKGADTNYKDNVVSTKYICLIGYLLLYITYSKRYPIRHKINITTTYKVYTINQ